MSYESVIEITDVEEDGTRLLVVPAPPPTPWSADLLPNLRGRWSAKSINLEVGSSIPSVPSSGGINNTISTGSSVNQPVLVHVGGDPDLPAMDFDGEDDYLTLADKTITKNASIFTMAVLFKLDEIDTDAAPKSFISIPAGSGGGTRIYVALENVAGAVKRYGISGRPTDAGSTSSTWGGPAADTNMHVLVVTLNRSTNPSSLKMWLDGTSIMDQVPTGMPQGAWDNVDSANGGNVGMRTSAAPKQSIDGKILDFVVLDAVLSDANRQLLEGCWAHDGKIPGQLPAGHPWKDARPYLD